jgi:hypothetical protein
MSDIMEVPIPQKGDPVEILSRITYDLTSLIALISDPEEQAEFITNSSILMVSLADAAEMTFSVGKEALTFSLATEMCQLVDLKVKAIVVAKKRDAAVNN